MDLYFKLVKWNWAITASKTKEIYVQNIIFYDKKGHQRLSGILYLLILKKKNKNPEHFFLSSNVDNSWKI